MVGNLFHGFGKARLPGSKMDCKFCSLQSSEGDDYKDMKKFILVLMLSVLEWKPIPFTWPFQTPKLTHSKMLQMFHYSKNLQKYSMVVFGSLYHSFAQDKLQNGM